MRWEISRDKYLSLSEVQQLLKSTEALAEKDASQFKDTWVRANMLIHLLLATGARIGEVQRLRHKDFWLDEGCLKLNGKGRKRFVPLPSDCLEHIRQYVDYKISVMMQPTEPNSHFFLSRLNQPYSIGGLEIMYKRALKAAGCKSIKGPHQLRHTFATHYVEKWKSLKDVQLLLGHSDLSVTSVYLDTPFSTLQKRCENLYSDIAPPITPTI